ncbi:unnamed protein product [Cylicocyclus nassatus]|uniref:Uncharacterized protein n=1 Tax=Cylicocyclus nassatus TaxID=53992 RepID=A0AA36MB12_CYLNA|nr:unnamed protein product [Cylicocyclus nassatus]
MALARSRVISEYTIYLACAIIWLITSSWLQKDVRVCRTRIATENQKFHGNICSSYGTAIQVRYVYDQKPGFHKLG